ncbi:MFS transporter [uncultured Endozoicomonas sp.]|uniref:MFS transporter n=1 Tax=uncultured Endozoicomonas sp. TaxID=432652 RepID=UPI002612B233|nr:MFS transporter [uncultured Endozoicomonas sp.]
MAVIESGVRAPLPRIPKWRLVLFSFGHFGSTLTAFSMGIVLSYFYFPPVVEGQTEIPELLPRIPILFGLTALGIITAISRVLDAFSSPYIANLSDRSQSRFGRRRLFMMIGFVPFALTSVATFFPPDDVASSLNIIWVAGSVLLFYLFMTLYVVPYGALIPELGKTADDRVFLAMMSAAAWGVAFCVGQTLWFFKGILEGHGMTSIEALQLIVVCFALLGTICMFVPLVVIDERRDCHGRSASKGALESMGEALKNKDFRVFVIVNCLTLMATYFLETGAVYYVTMLLGLEEQWATPFMVAMFFASFALYPLVVRLTRFYPKKHIYVVALMLEGAVFSMIPFAPSVTYPLVLAGLIVLLGAIPIAVTSIIPAAMMTDITLSDTRRTGEHKEATFFGLQSLNVKLAGSVTSLIFPSLLIIGSNHGQPTELGVSLTAWIGCSFSFIACGVLFLYNEERVNKYLNEAVS